MARTFCFGDVQGCLEELEELHKTLGYKKGIDRSISLGDLTDRGPDSLGCIRYCMENGIEVVFSNHDEKHLRYYNYEQKKKIDPKFKNPLDPMSYDWMKVQNSLTEKEFNFISSLPARKWINDRIIAVHAGFEPGLPLDKQTIRSMIRVKYVNAEGLWKDGEYWSRPSGGYYWAEGWKGPQCVVFGHDTVSLRVPKLYGPDKTTGAWALGLDTGCCYGGRLTALVVYDEKDNKEPELVQIKAKRIYYSGKSYLD